MSTNHITAQDEAKVEKIEAGHPNSQSADPVKQNLEALKRLFPTIVKEGKLDVEELKALLGEEVETGEEYYRFDWAGKSMARREANKPSTATLRPDKAESKNWDSTGNLFIEGDNLEVLKLLQKSYANQIKMIYIDPPYNTGKDFVYKDNYTDNLGNYLSITGQTDAEGNKLGTNTESDGRYHSNWLNMMYPRLKLARNLLKDDGAIFISIDDNEVHNLRKVSDEIFGEENFVGEMIWAAGRKNDSRLISISHENIICYAKTKDFLKEKKILWRQRKKGLEEIYTEAKKIIKEFGDDYSLMSSALKAWYKSLPEGHPSKAHKHYNQVDFRGVYFAADISWPGGGGPKYDVKHPITGISVKTPSRGWITPDINKMQEWIEEDRVHFGEDENFVPCLKKYLKDSELQTPYSVFYQDGRAASKRLRLLMDGDVFPFPKDEIVVEELAEMLTNGSDIILDFFAGSGTTAHAVMKLNVEDGGNRKFICVQLPEPTPDNSEARKAGYTKISDITKERICRAGEKVKSEAKADMFAQSNHTLDIGFKVFKLDSSNIRAWEGNPENLEANLFSSVENIKGQAEGRTEDDVLYEILIKNGLEQALTMPIEERIISGKKVYNIGFGALFICLADGIGTAVAEGIGQWKEEMEVESCTVIFKDNGFSVVEKVNSLQILKRYSITEVNTI